MNVFPPKINSAYNFNNDGKETESQDGSNNTCRCDGLFGGEGFRDYSQGACQGVEGEDKIPQDIGNAAITQRCLSLDQSKSPPLRRRQVTLVWKRFVYTVT